MRLIDADALPYCREARFMGGKFEYGEEFVYKSDIDAALTVSCGECELDGGVACRADEDWKNNACSYFERRQP
jgi:hypothetical protein